jgi:hypothetical protein
MKALFYDNPFVLNANEHGGLRLKDEIGCAFARDAVAVPLTLAEFSVASRFYPICFTGENRQPLAVLGVKEGQNLYVDETGAWRPGAYVPAYVRRYPFILAEASGDQVLLAMESDEDVLVAQAGRPLFEEGRPSAQALAALDFCRNYLAGVRATEAFVQALDAAGLLVERRAAFQPNEGEPSTVRGFRVVDPDKLRALDDAVLGEWNRRDWLAPLYAHLQSMSLWPDLFEQAARADEDKKSARPKAKRAKLN